MQKKRWARIICFTAVICGVIIIVANLFQKEITNSAEDIMNVLLSASPSTNVADSSEFTPPRLIRTFSIPTTIIPDVPPFNRIDNYPISPIDTSQPNPLESSQEVEIAAEIADGTEPIKRSFTRKILGNQSHLFYHGYSVNKNSITLDVKIVLDTKSYPNNDDLYTFSFIEIDGYSEFEGTKMWIDNDKKMVYIDLYNAKSQRIYETSVYISLVDLETLSDFIIEKPQ
jgi:hypothetical protein